MTFHGGLINLASGDFATGSIAIIFWDGVYNAAAGLPYFGSGAAQTQKLAQTANGTNGYLIRFSKIASLLDFYTVEFDTTMPADAIHPAPAATQQPMRITDPQGRFGYMIAAVQNSGPSPGNPANVWHYNKGAANGLNAAFLYQNYTFKVSATPNSSGGYTHTLKPGTTPAGAILGSTLIPGRIAYTPLTDSDFNVGKISQAFDPNTMEMVPVSLSMPVNPWVTFYGKRLNGTTFATGELRGRIRNQGFDPDRPDSLTQVLESGSGATLPGERLSNHYLFSFITPPIDTAQINPKVVWDSTRLPAGYSVAYEQELYAEPSYGQNDDGANANPPAANTPLHLNYRLRGIPAGTYTLLVQQKPIYGVVTDNGAMTLIQNTETPTNQYPGADFASACIPRVTIVSSLWLGPTPAPDNYSNPVTLDIKLHRPADIDDGSGRAVAADGQVDIGDFGILVNGYGNVGAPGDDPADFAGNTGINSGEPDGRVDIADFGILINEYNDGTEIRESAAYD